MTIFVTPRKRYVNEICFVDIEPLRNTEEFKEA